MWIKDIFKAIKKQGKAGEICGIDTRRKNITVCFIMPVSGMLELWDYFNLRAQ